MSQKIRVLSEPWYDKVIRVCVYLIVAGVPAIFTPAFFSAFSMPKLALLQILTVVIMVSWGYGIFIDGKITYLKSRFNLLLLIYGIVCLISTALSVSFFSSIFGTQGRYIGVITILNFIFLAFVCFNRFRKTGHIMTFLLVNIVTSGILALYGFFQYTGVLQEGVKWSQNPLERVFGTVGHANHFGAYLGMGLVSGVLLIPLVRNRIHRILMIVLLIFIAIVIVLTGSRGALVGVFCGLFYASVVLLAGKGKRIFAFVKNRIWMFISIMFVLGILICSVSIGLLKIPLVERSVQTIGVVGKGQLPDRLSWWMSTLQMIADRPLFGYGISSFRDVYNLYRRTDYIVPGPGDMQDMITPEAAHNEYLNIGATQGIMGLVAFLLLVLFPFLGLNSDSKTSWIAVSLRSAMVVYLGQIFFSFGVITTTTLFFIFLGISSALKEEKSKTVEVDLAVPFRYAIVCSLLFIAFWYTFFSYKELMADYYYKRAQIETARGNLDKAIIAYQNTVDSHPFEYSYYQDFGDFALKSSSIGGISAETGLKFLNLAVVEYSRAIALNNHHPSTNYNKGIAEFQIYKAIKDKIYLDNAVESLSRAIMLSVNNPLYLYQSARAYMGCSEKICREKAAMSLKKALDIRPGYKDAEILLEGLR